MTTPACPSYTGYQLPVPGRDHQPRGLALLSLSAQLAHENELLAARGIIVCHVTVRQWVLKFG